MKMGFANLFLVDSIGRSGGLKVFWKGTVNCSIIDYSQKHIDLVFYERTITT